MKRSKNKWGGEDFTGQNGMARWIKDDGDIIVHCFFEHMALKWAVLIGRDAPFSIFQAALEAAKAEAK